MEKKLDYLEFDIQAGFNCKEVEDIKKKYQIINTICLITSDKLIITLDISELENGQINIIRKTLANEIEKEVENISEAENYSVLGEIKKDFLNRAVSNRKMNIEFFRQECGRLFKMCELLHELSKNININLVDVKFANNVYYITIENSIYMLKNDCILTKADWHKNTFNIIYTFLVIRINIFFRKKYDFSLVDYFSTMASKKYYLFNFQTLKKLPNRVIELLQELF